MEQIFTRCSLDEHPNQKYCGLVEHYKAANTVNECPYKNECNELKTHINHEEGNINEII